MSGLAKLLGLPSPTVLIGIVLTIVISGGVAGYFGIRASNLSSQVESLDAKLKAEKQRADGAEGTLRAWKQRQAQADAAAAQDAARTQSVEVQAAVQKGEIDVLEKQLGARPVSDLTRAHLERVRHRQRR